MIACLGWIGLDWIGLGWTGLVWDEVELDCDALDWKGPDWIGLSRTGLAWSAVQKGKMGRHRPNVNQSGFNFKTLEQNDCNAFRQLRAQLRFASCLATRLKVQTPPSYKGEPWS